MCTRVFNNLNDEFLTTARNMDWATQLPTTIYSFQKNLEKSGMAEIDSSTLTWKSYYDSVVTMVVGEENGVEHCGASDGMNTAGLVANVLYDSGAQYQRKDGSSCKNLDVLRWVQYVLDTCCSVEEVVEKFNHNSDIQINASLVPSSGKPASLHLSVSDIFGDSAIIEVIKGEYHVHSKPSHQVMTNEPSFTKQIKINQYWKWQWSDKNQFPSHTIPGGPFPTDRFERAAFNMHHLSKPTSSAESLAQSKSVAANASVPIGFDFGVANSPNIAPTLWSTISSHNELMYYFDNARTTGVCWIDLANLKHQHNSAKLPLVTFDKGLFSNHSYHGLINQRLVVTSDPFALPQSGASLDIKRNFELDVELSSSFELS
ncbi:linear amide C-N hydrolase [Photobacterium minamisatsumaniensis]|uniref:linear amide C-N hydrolase n=1 Tax=Photobacterium minamisatsumaniensis TaxID=2910233 RepID=UPI003D135C51